MIVMRIIRRLINESLYCVFGLFLFLVLCACDNGIEQKHNYDEDSIQYETSDFRITYDELNECFVIHNYEYESISNVKCPKFWIDDSISLEEYENVAYDDKLHVLEISTLDDKTGKYTSYFFELEDATISLISEVECYDYYRDTPYYGKKILIEGKLSENEFNERIKKIFERYNISNPICMYSKNLTENDNEQCYLYYDSKSDYYFVFYGKHNDNKNVYAFYYSICLLAEKKEILQISEPYEFFSTEGTTGEEKVDQWEEMIDNEDNRIISYKSKGTCNLNLHNIPYYEDGDEVDLLSFEYIYDNNNNLLVWRKNQNHFLWGMNYSIREFICDDSGRCSNANFILTSGEENVFYVYDNNGNEPKYIIDFVEFNNLLQVLEY